MSQFARCMMMELLQRGGIRRRVGAGGTCITLTISNPPPAKMNLSGLENEAVGKVLAWHAQRPEFDPQHIVISALRKWMPDQKFRVICGSSGGSRR